MPKISVIIPVYNKEKYLAKSLDSVLTQEYQDVEVIAVNDGSTDQSLEIIREKADMDGRIRIVDIPNGGVSKARNVGLAHACGEWIQFLDADDLLEGSYLQNAMQILEQYPVDIFFSSFTMVDERMNSVRVVSLQESGVKKQNELCDCFINNQKTTGFFGYISNKLFRRDLWVKSGAQFPEGTTLAEDLDFYAKLYPAVEKAYFWNGNSFFYLQTESNYAYNSKIDYYSQIEIHLDIKEWFIKSGMYEKYRTELNGRISEYAYFIMFYDNEENGTIEKAIAFLCSRADIMESIIPSYMNGFARVALACLCQNRIAALKTLFAGRNAVRSIYRVVRKNG